MKDTIISTAAGFAYCTDKISDPTRIITSGMKIKLLKNTKNIAIDTIPLNDRIELWPQYDFE